MCFVHTGTNRTHILKTSDLTWSSHINKTTIKAGNHLGIPKTFTTQKSEDQRELCRMCREMFMLIESFVFVNGYVKEMAKRKTNMRIKKE